MTTDDKVASSSSDDHGLLEMQGSSGCLEHNKHYISKGWGKLWHEMLSSIFDSYLSRQCLNKGSSHLRWCKPRRGLSRCPWGRWSWREYQHGWLERKQQPHWGSAGRNATPRSSARGPGEKKSEGEGFEFERYLESHALQHSLCVLQLWGVWPVNLL